MPALRATLAAVIFLSCRLVLAQSAPADTPSFDVAVIRPTATPDVMGSSHSHIWSRTFDTHFKAENVSALQLIQSAYNLPELRIEGGPDWVRTRRFDLEAKSETAADERLSKLPSDEARARKRRMLQALLADRFGLKVHEETRTQPVFALVVARGGPKFQPSQKNGTTTSTNGINGNMTMTVQGSDHTLHLLAEQLGRQLSRVVVDKTGLDGRFDLTLKYVSDDLRNTGPDAPSGPSLFTAIQEQLGLKLESEKGPVTILVIDHVEPPSEN
jgi:uncharacterized protein (TIGR03435 family)